MKTFHCTHCQHLVFFENVSCLNCGHALAYLPDRNLMAAMSRMDDGSWRLEGRDRPPAAYRLCANYAGANVCNWAIPGDDLDALCRSCRLTRVIPELTAAGREAWVKLESAKRRLLQGLMSLQLPVAPRDERNPDGVLFQFLKDSTQADGDSHRVLTGHDNGLITINISEADDVQRESQRQRQHEPYRTLLGHFRHEIGHYYWDLLIRDRSRLKAFRARFGDERANYAKALKRHYRTGPPPDWAESFVSAYAASHPWEDWAECWAHFLHMTDALETADAAGLSLKPRRSHEPALAALPPSTSVMDLGFDRMIERWLPLTYLMNNVSRGLGLRDNYPFVLMPAVIEKLRFIYQTINEQRDGSRSLPAIAFSVVRAVGYTALLSGAALGIVALLSASSAQQTERES